MLIKLCVCNRGVAGFLKRFAFLKVQQPPDFKDPGIWFLGFWFDVVATKLNLI